MELKEQKELSQEEIGMIRVISDDLYEHMSCKNSKIITKDLVFQIYLTLIISIVNLDILQIFDYDDKNITEKYLQDKYDDLLNIKKINFSSKDLKKRTEAKYFYYEKAIKLRSEIQNRKWSYHNLDSDAATFIRTRELTKIMYNKTKTMDSKKEYLKCYNCGTKWLENENDNCPRCDKENDLTMFVRLCDYFCVMSDMENFYNNLNKETENFILDNWAYIDEYFRKELRRNYADWYNNIKREKGEQQYKKICKRPDVEKTLPEEFKSFNKKYNLALEPQFLELDLRDAEMYYREDKESFLNNLSTLYFPCVQNVILPERKIDFNSFKPDMPFLTKIIARGCQIKKINLDETKFKKLKYLELQRNNIETIQDIESLLKIKSLKVIDVHNNPIEEKNEIFRAEDLFSSLNKELRYNMNVKLFKRRDIDNESDSELREIQKKYIDYDESSEENSILKKFKYC